MEIRLVNDVEDPGRRGIGPPQYAAAGADAVAATPAVDIRLMVQRYWLLFIALILMGAGVGFAYVVLTPAMYRAELTLEIKNIDEGWFKGVTVSGSPESDDINIQTQINILRGGTFLRRGADRVRSEAVPARPAGNDIFSRLRERFRPVTRDPMENMRRSINLAINTFDVRPMAKTRLIVLSCDSTSPEIAAHFLNAMATEFVEDNSKSHTQITRKTSDWLSGQIEEYKSKVQDAETRLREFVQGSGNLFAGQETATLADTELSQAKAKLTEIRSLRIAAQTRYEIAQSSQPDALTEVQNDPFLHQYQAQMNALKQEKAALLVTLMPKHEKVQKIDAQLAQLEQVYQQQRNAIVKKIRDDYESAKREEQHRVEDYNVKAQRAASETGKASQYAALKREVETLRGMYQSLLMQDNQVGMNGSAPVNPIRIVEPSIPASVPYKPRPLVNISFGAIFGIAIGAGLAFLRERMDQRIRAPGSSRRFLNTRELGVIPNLNVGGNLQLEAGGTSNGTLSAGGSAEGPGVALATWKNAPGYLAESFRGTLASILGTRGSGAPAYRALLVTSAGPGEGKTTVVQNLGIALAETGRRILLVDGDFRRPHLHKRFHLSNQNSLMDLLGAETSLADWKPEHSCLPSGVAGLSVLPNRATDNSVARALYSPRLRVIFQKLREAYDMILVDAPPILHLADARIIGPLADAVILVLRSGVTNRDNATEAYRVVQEDGLFLLGTILTDWDASASYLRKHYYYDYADEPPK